MASFSKIQQRLKNFDFAGLFTQELLWNNFSGHDLDVPVDGKHYKLAPIAEQSGLAVYLCTPSTVAEFPDYPTRRKIDNRVTKFVREHIVIYQDPAKKYQVWQWVKREAGKASACREQRFEVHQTGDALIQKLFQIKFALEDEPTIGEAREKVKKAFDLEKVTKRFYEEFKGQHAVFLKYLKGIPDEHLQRWYASVMLNRLMFIYFIQKKGFLGGDLGYLGNRLSASKKNGKNEFYREFLCPLFFEGFAKQESDRSAKTKQLLGNIPYLNGGLFLKHQIEQAHGKNIEIPDLAFEKIFAFFDQYQWHLDDRPTRDGNEINPDVLGYVFEKYINQKEMGAYYTKEDITGYIGQNTIIPAVFDIARKGSKIAFEGDHCIWNLLKEDPNRYFYAAVLHGTARELPKEIAAGVKDVAKRGDWNKTAPEEYGLPAETWREAVARRQRYEEVRGKLAAGAVRSIDNLITYNLDIQRFAEEVISNSEGSELVWAFYKAVEKLSVLDPTCGSGAFLFAALNILEKLYDTCLVRMQAFVDDLDHSGEKHSPKKFEHFRLKLAEMNDKSKHPSPRYFVLKSIILNNLYGVDIMEEATEICKLRLFLKLVAQVNAGERIEPLPDIDFNIKSGNTLVGIASKTQLKGVLGETFDFGENRLAEIEESAEQADMAYAKFRDSQVQQDTDPASVARAKGILQDRLSALRSELDDLLAGEYGIKKSDKAGRKAWRESHQPFHWFIEFFGIMRSGGFDAIIGNPPYVEYSKVRESYEVHGYETLSSGNLYCYVLERSTELLKTKSFLGLIIPLGAFATARMSVFQDYVWQQYESTFLSFYSGDAHPSVLFQGVKYRLAIIVAQKNLATDPSVFTSGYIRWYAEEREYLFPKISYQRCDLKAGYLRFARLESELALSILKKLLRKGRELGQYKSGTGGGVVHYHRSPVFWIRAMDFEPYFKSATRSRSDDHLRDLFFPDQKTASAIGAVLNSTCFFFWFITQGNCRDVAGPDVDGFPLGDLSTDQRLRLGKLGAQLMADLQKNSKRRVYNYRASGRVEYDEFYPRLSKSYIDQIDLALEEHYGLTPEETDYLVNFDVKYRMGLVGADDDEEAEAFARAAE